ncbi:hypothetical protein [Trueperella sp. LYQ143]|uniref:hypothetical protein n=1 Tax=unclassified Trueperella TaxID=2630174 RepID=UPI0039838475
MSSKRRRHRPTASPAKPVRSQAPAGDLSSGHVGARVQTDTSGNGISQQSGQGASARPVPMPPAQYRQTCDVSSLLAELEDASIDEQIATLEQIHHELSNRLSGIR